MPGYRADDYVSRNGPKGNGVSYQYDSKTGKYGRLYDDGMFVPDPDEKQPGYRPPKQPSEPAPGPSGPSSCSAGTDDIYGTLKGTYHNDEEDTGESITGILAALVVFAAIITLQKKYAEDPEGVKGAAIKTGRTIACAAGMILNTIVILVYLAIFAGIENPVAKVAGTIIAILLIYTDYGLTRVARGKPFWINPAAAFPKPKTIKVPKIAYIGIELLVTALLTMPILNFINSFTVEWANQNQDTIADSTVIILGIAMLVGSIIIAAIIGLVVCGLVKAITAK